ncbi:MAG: tetratricopeptide repeat protein [Planctomycetes bacterium]|nr:tetratricopeptide repeat protein [Planctomycetota bacterium]
MKTIPKLLPIAVLAFASLGCMKNDNERVKAASWDHDDKNTPPPGKTVTDAPTPRISANTHLASGRMLEQQNDLTGAIRQYEKAIANNPRLVEGHNRLGIAYQKLERMTDAERYFKRGLSVAPDSAMLHNNLGYCYLLQDKLQAAESEFKNALAISPAFERARMNYAIVLARTDRFEESVKEFTQVVPAEVAYYNVAVICCEKEQFSEAEDALRRSLKINPKYQPASDQLDRIVALADEKRGPNRVRINLAEEHERAGEDAALQP